jgi:hypothetical protein
MRRVRTSGSNCPMLPKSPLALPLLLLLLAGCSWMPWKRPLPEVTDARQVKVPVRVPVVEPADATARHFIGYHDRVRSMSPAELQQEVQRIGDPAQSFKATMELSVVLGLTRNPSDVQRAIGLLDNLLRSPAPEAADWLPWARLLRSRYGEQRRVEDQLEKQTQALRESQRKLEQVNQQLEAVKAIERSLTPKPAPGASDARPAP